MNQICSASFLVSLVSLLTEIRKRSNMGEIAFISPPSQTPRGVIHIMTCIHWALHSELIPYLILADLIRCCCSTLQVGILRNGVLTACPRSPSCRTEFWSAWANSKTHILSTIVCVLVAWRDNTGIWMTMRFRTEARSSVQQWRMDRNCVGCERRTFAFDQ